MSRLPTGGLIHRQSPVAFKFQERVYQGFAGDTLASALLASGVKLMGRSFKYHRPRGVLTAGSDEPNALVEVIRSGDVTPNQRATVQEIYPGLEARAQNYVGALELDFMAINDWLAPFIGAGFYYKTFMWPKSFWERVFEPLIRRAAGLGSLSGQADADLHDKAWAYCDLLVIGAGPSGLMAALVAGRAGKRIILADEDFVTGGRLTSDPVEIDQMPGADWAAHAVQELVSMPNVTVMPRTTVIGAYDGGTFGAVERVSEHLGTSDAPLSTFWRIVAGRAILATGASERPISFPGNDRPGIMTASAIATYVGRYAVAPGRRVALFINNSSGFDVADQLIAAGIRLGAIITPMEALPKRYNCRTFTQSEVIDTRGRLGLSGLKVRGPDGRTEWIDCDCLGVSGGWNPVVHLSCHLGGRPVWCEDIAAFVPAEGAVPGMLAAGACRGAFSTHRALKEGARAAAQAFELADAEVPEASDQAFEIKPFWKVDAPGRAWLDLQNDVTVKDVVQAHQENFRSVEHMKRYTTLGMATDQGKTANVNALAIMAELTGQSIPQTGTTTFRPPYSSVAIAAMGAGGAGTGFAPERFSTGHSFCVEKGAVMVEAGLWYRPGYFPQRGDVHWREACDREVGYVRQTVGVCDVSSLGKIDIQGPDAGAFLDFVYTNRFSNLKVGRVRYGLMLREDGFVMDDGTTARLGDAHYLMTTTTAAASQVMAHLEFVHQCLRPDLDVRFVSVTDQWAQFAVAGPKARDVLGKVLDDPGACDLPYMGCGEVTVAGQTGRLFRISFSGELGFEVAVPARYGDAVLRQLAGSAEALGGGLYGLEALNVLRIEKGFLTHAEIHGRVTARDCGLKKMVSLDKDCIGKVMAGRPHLTAPGREQLVGIRPSGAAKRLFGGSHIVGLGDAPVRQNDQGYVTSVCYSPTLDSMIGLAFIRDGHDRIGERVRAVDLLREFDTECEICPVPFFDPSGERARGNY